MAAIVIQVLTMVAQISGALSDVGSIATVIATLQSIVSAGIQEVETVAPMIKNIITALRSNGQVTQDQLAQLDALDSATDQAFENAAAAAGAAPDPNAAT
jgi:hypothetical protein